MSSFKQMIQAGEIKRADAMKLPYDSIHIEPGFNGRIPSDASKDDDDALLAHIMAGGQLPALEVRPRDEGGVWVVEGHRRHKQYGRAIAAGAPIEFIHVVPFVGNDADRVARIVTSNSQLPLTPLETARVYKRLAAFGLTPDEIAAKVNKTRQHVDQLMVLANANTDVQRMVAAGGVSAAVAVKVARQHGEGAGQVLQQELDKAKAAGKGKVTDGTMKVWAPPLKVVQPLVASVDELLESLGREAHESISAFRNGTKPDPWITVDGSLLMALLDSHQALADARKAAEQKSRDKAAKAAQGELVEGGAA